jgi:hypothetical protein
MQRWRIEYNLAPELIGVLSLDADTVRVDEDGHLVVWGNEVRPNNALVSFAPGIWRIYGLESVLGVVKRVEHIQAGVSHD